MQSDGRGQVRSGQRTHLQSEAGSRCRLTGQVRSGQSTPAVGGGVAVQSDGRGQVRSEDIPGPRFTNRTYSFVGASLQFVTYSMWTYEPLLPDLEVNLWI